MIICKNCVLPESFPGIRFNEEGICNYCSRLRGIDKQKEKKEQELEEKVKKLQDFTYETRTDLRQKRDEKFREEFS